MPTERMGKKAYSAPRIVDFGSIETTTGDCLGFCLDALNGGLFLLGP